jgi:alkaline phosphatase
MRLSPTLLSILGIPLIIGGCSTSGEDGSAGAAGAPATPTASIADRSVAEGSADHSESLTVTLNPAPTSTMTIQYRVRAGSAANGSDWTCTASTGTLTFAAGQSSQAVSLTVKGDIAVEGSETVYVDLYNPSSGLTVADACGCLSITNDDAGGMAKNVILFIGDGMNLNHEIAGSRYKYGSDFGLSFHGFDYKAYVNTWDVTTYNKYATAAGDIAFADDNFLALIGYDHIRGGAIPSQIDEPLARSYFLTLLSGKEPATDSASAGTALACGRKTDDGNVAWKTGDPVGGSYSTIAQMARAAGMKMGVVSTVPFTHATPACFVSHNVNRGNYKGTTSAFIDYEIVQVVKPDVVIGGGHPTWDAAYMDATNKTFVAAGGTANEYQYVERVAGQNGGTNLDAAVTAALAASPQKKLFGLFGGAGGNFEYYTVADTPGTPAFTPISTENPTLAQCTTAALKMLTNNGASTAGSFVMIEQGDIDWANHANHFPNMIGGVHDLDAAVSAAVSFVNIGGDQVDWTNTLIIVTSDHSNSYMRLRSVLGKGDLPAVDGAGKPNDGTVSYSTTNHTNEPVCLYAKGAGKGLFKAYEGQWNDGTALIDNTQIFWVMVKALGLTASVPATNSQNVELVPIPVNGN